MSKSAWRIGQAATIQCPDGKRRPATLTNPGFRWVTHDGTYDLFAEGGYDPRPLLTPTPTTAPPIERPSCHWDRCRRRRELGLSGCVAWCKCRCHTLTPTPEASR